MFVSLLILYFNKVNDFERRLLVWTGKYKTKEEIPNYVAPEQVEK